MPHKEQCIEFDIFEWDSWDTIEEGVYDFSGITLKVAIGPNNPGRKFSHAIVNYATSTITFYDTADDEVGHKYGLALSVTEYIGPKMFRNGVPVEGDPIP